MLTSRDTSRQIKEKVLKELDRDNSITSFSTAAQKLMDLTQQQNVQMGEISEIVKTEAGLAARVLKLANSIVYGGSSIKNIDEALLRIGMEEIKKMSMTIGVMDRVSHLHVKIDWNMYWMHCLLTARITELLAGVYREPTGKEYLAGLLHDIGKIFLEHHFPDAFESVMLRAIERGCGMYEVENQLYDIAHPEVGALLCSKWGLNPEIIRSVQFHHEPESPLNKDPLHPEEQHLLATCVSVADSISNMCKINIQGARRFRDPNIETLPEWIALQKYPPIGSLNLELPLEIQKVEETMAAFQS